MFFRIIIAFLTLLSVAITRAKPTSPDAIAKEILAPLLDQAKIATLKGDRPINTRTYKVHYWLEIGHRAAADVPAMLGGGTGSDRRQGLCSAKD